MDNNIVSKDEFDVLDVDDVSVIKNSVNDYIERGIDKKDVKDKDFEKEDAIVTVKKSYFSLLNFYIGYTDYESFVNTQEEIEDKYLEFEDKKTSKLQSMRDIPADMIRTRILYSSYPKPVREMSYWIIRYLFKRDVPAKSINENLELYKKAFGHLDYNINVINEEYKNGATRINLDIHPPSQKDK
jgi:hypothetical protein